MRNLLIPLLLAAAPLAAWADQCDNPRNEFDAVYCMNKVYASADKDLNTNYQALRARLSNADKNTLRRAQIRWIRERDNQCVDGKGIDVRCRLEMTQQRNHWLLERLRECKTVGCKPSELNG